MERDPHAFGEANWRIARVRADSVEAGWRAVEPFLDAWKKAGRDELKTYDAGSEGPEGANDLLKRDGRSWRA